MKTKILVAALLCTSLLGAVAEEAAPGAGKRVREGGGEGKRMREGGGDRQKAPIDRFKATDTDGDGVITLDEFTALHEKRLALLKERMGDKFDAARADKMPKPADIFAKLDKDASGGLTPEELAADTGDRQKMQERARAGKPRGERPAGKPRGERPAGKPRGEQTAAKPADQPAAL